MLLVSQYFICWCKYCIDFGFRIFIACFVRPKHDILMTNLFSCASAVTVNQLPDKIRVRPSLFSSRWIGGITYYDVRETRIWRCWRFIALVMMPFAAGRATSRCYASPLILPARPFQAMWRAGEYHATWWLSFFRYLLRFFWLFLSMTFRASDDY